jgi:serine/threonine-protein kinase
MAVVWRARMHGAAGFSRPVAVKQMKPALQALPDHVAMFVEEACVGSALSHPNIVQVIDFVEDADGSYCLVTEWVEGLDLGRFLQAYRKRGERMGWAMAVAIAVGALRGLTAAHNRTTALGEPAPIVHRDVSPSNILLGVDGVVKLIDFGLARPLDGLSSLKAPMTVKGKVPYLSPEIVRRQNPGPSSDLFSMGAVLWEMLVGDRLFQGSDQREQLRKIRDAVIVPLTAKRSGLPEKLVAIVHQSLSGNPAERCVSAHAMAQALVQVLVSTLGGGRDAQAQVGHAVADIRQAAL